MVRPRSARREGVWDMAIEQFVALHCIVECVPIMRDYRNHTSSTSDCACEALKLTPVTLKLLCIGFPSKIELSRRLCSAVVSHTRFDVTAQNFDVTAYYQIEVTCWVGCFLI